jgi:dipeptidyl aminopeptidase/acylaminoacyl peptidase
MGAALSTNIVVLDAAGVGPQQVIAPSFSVEFGDPAWSPDGRLITYTRYGSTSELWVMNQDGTNRTQLVLANVTNPQTPDFSPDGKLLIVTGQPAGVAGASKELFSLAAPTAPLAAPATLAVTATRLTTVGNVNSTDWQRKLVATQQLNVSLTGTGVVTSQPTGINCSTKCSATFVAGAKVTLTATPGKGSKFVNWSGACTTKATTCTVTMTQARSVVANFKKK